jgi:hypothetical protein
MPAPATQTNTSATGERERDTHVGAASACALRIRPPRSGGDARACLAYCDRSLARQLINPAAAAERSVQLPRRRITLSIGLHQLGLHASAQRRTAAVFAKLQI